MFPLVISDTLQQIIVSAIIGIAAVGIVRILFKSHRRKSDSCAKCHPE